MLSGSCFNKLLHKNWRSNIKQQPVRMHMHIYVCYVCMYGDLYIDVLRGSCFQGCTSKAGHTATLEFQISCFIQTLTQRAWHTQWYVERHNHDTPLECLMLLYHCRDTITLRLPWKNGDWLGWRWKPTSAVRRSLWISDSLNPDIQAPNPRVAAASSMSIALRMSRLLFWQISVK